MGSATGVWCGEGAKIRNRREVGGIRVGEAPKNQTVVK